MIRHTLLRWTARLLFVPIADAVDWDTVNLRDHVDDERLAETLDWSAIDPYHHGLDRDEHLSSPVERLFQLEDADDRAYVWLVESDAAERQVTNLISEAYRQDFGRDPRAAHFVVSDIEKLRAMDPNAVRMVDPIGGDS